MRSALSGALALLVYFPSASAFAAGPPTIHDNYQSFPVGSRAAGMGGAYTALACDEAALHYNPAALACAADSHLELAANAYLVQGLSLPNAVGPGEDIRATSYHSIPSIVGGVRILSEGDPETREGRLAFGLTVSVPRSVALKVDPPTPDKVNYISLSVRDDITAADVGLGYQINRVWGVGLSLGAVLRTYQSHQQILVTRTTPTPCGPPAGAPAGQCVDYLFPVSDQELLAVGARAKLGVRATPTRELSLGLAVVSPTIDFFGNSKLSETDALTLSSKDQKGLTTTSWAAIPTRLEGSSGVGFPLRVAIGAAYTTSFLTLALDASLNFPRQVVFASSLRAVAVQGVPPPPAQALADRVQELDFQPNVNLGVEIPITATKVVDLGAFTDFSSVSEQQIKKYQSDRVHQFGGSLALGLLGRQARGWFGASFEMGSAGTMVPSGSYDLEQIQRTGFSYDTPSTVTRWTLSGVIGSNYAFLKEK